jgi:hypothetical protein
MVRGTARVRQTQSTRTCTTCQVSIPSRDLYLDVADYKMCKLCAKKHGRHVGPWKRGARLQLLP